MFKRRNPLSLSKKFQELVWPSMGWARMAAYLKHRTTRIPDSSYRITMGLALGAAISFSPFVFTHIIQGCIIAFFVRANYIAVAIGTIIGNPWTFPFIWYGSIKLGAYIFSLFGLPASTYVPEAVTLEIFWSLIKNDPFRILLPWMTGGYLLCLITLPIIYFSLLPVIKAAKRARRNAIMRKTKKQITQEATS